MPDLQGKYISSLQDLGLVFISKKISKNRNDFMKKQLLQKYQQIFCKDFYSFPLNSTQIIEFKILENWSPQ